MAFVKVAEAAEVPVGEGKVVVGGAAMNWPCSRWTGNITALIISAPMPTGRWARDTLRATAWACPWHAWQFSVKTGKMLYNPEVSVQSYACKVEDGGVFVDV